MNVMAKELKLTERLDDVGCKSRANDGGCNWRGRERGSMLQVADGEARESFNRGGGVGIGSTGWAGAGLGALRDLGLGGFWWYQGRFSSTQVFESWRGNASGAGERTSGLVWLAGDSAFHGVWCHVGFRFLMSYSEDRQPGLSFLAPLAVKHLVSGPVDVDVASASGDCGPGVACGEHVTDCLILVSAKQATLGWTNLIVTKGNGIATVYFYFVIPYQIQRGLRV
ncbi:hypothetical protein VCV18_003051 [Metarhizium anisopliae]